MNDLRRQEQYIEVVTELPAAISVPPTGGQRRLSPLAQKLIEMRVRFANGAARLRIIMLINSKGLIKPAKRASGPCGTGVPCVGPQTWSTVRRHDRRGWNRKRCRPTVF